MSKVIIYCDGSCLGNPGPGGWGAVIDGKEISGCEAMTTNNRMELTAAIQSLTLAKMKGCEIVQVVTDSKYVIKGITEWMINWKRNGWRTAARKAVLNDDLWKELDRVCDGMNIEWEWVKGHSGHELNERADRLAANAAMNQ